MSMKMRGMKAGLQQRHYTCSTRIQMMHPIANFFHAFCNIEIRISYTAENESSFGSQHSICVFFDTNNSTTIHRQF